MKPSAPVLFSTLLALSIGLAWGQDPPPSDAPVLTYPADAAPSVILDNYGGLTLDWESVAAADSYEVQLGPMPMGIILPTVIVTVDSTARYVTNLSKGVPHQWHVRAKNAGGDGPWSATQTFTTDPLLSPNLVSPSPGAFGLPPKPTINFTWLDNNPPLPPIGPPGPPPMPGMGYVYQLQVSTDPLFPPASPPMPGFPPNPPYIADLTFSDPPFTFSHDTAVSGFTYGRTYYWRVKTTLGLGTSAWSPIRSFTTALPPPTTITLVNPEPGTVNVPALPVLAWTDSNRPISPMPGTPGFPAPFWVRVATDSTFPDLAPMPPGMGIPPTPPYVINELVQDTSLALVNPLTRGQKYYWRVMVQEANGGNGSYASGSFSVLPQPPDMPALVSPVPQAVDIPLHAPLTWTTAARASRYRVQIGVDSTFSDTLQYEDTPTPGATLTVNLSPSTRYFWRVRAENSAGNSAFTAPEAFTTVPPVPAAPVLVAPRQDSADTPDLLTLTWSNIVGLTYHVQLASDAGFSNLVAADSGLSDGSALLQWNTPALTKGSSYHWRVRGKNAGGAGAWSTPFRFTVIPPVPTVPTVESPLPGALEVSLSPTLVWRKTPFAATYSVQVAADPAFASPLSSHTGWSDTTLAIGPLAHAQAYYWRVSAANVSGVGAWSTPVPFTTIQAAPGTPTLVSPAAGAINRPILGLVLHITGAAGSAAYDYQVSTDSAFTSKVLDDSLFSSQEHPVVALALGTPYWWRARARNSGGIGPWSDSRTFTTLPAPPNRPTMLSPDSIALNLPLSVTLVCSRVPGADGYIFKTSKMVNQGGNFSFVTVDSAAGPDTTRPVGPLEHGATYLWTVWAQNQGGLSLANTNRSFTTVPSLPPAVSLVYPATGVTLTGDSLTGRWHPVGQMAFRYFVQVSQDSAFTSPVTDSLVFDTLKVIRYAAGNGRYWWRVQACNIVGCGPYSEARWFLVNNPVTSLAGGLRLTPGFDGSSSLLRYALADASRVTLSLFDLHGSERARPVDGWQSAGSHAVDLEAVDGQGRRLRRGWYLLRLEAKPAAATTATGRPTLHQEAPIFLGP